MKRLALLDLTYDKICYMQPLSFIINDKRSENIKKNNTRNVETIKICFHNFAGINNKLQNNSLFRRFINKEEFDTILGVETKTTQEKEKILYTLPNYKCKSIAAISNGSGVSNGMVQWFNTKMTKYVRINNKFVNKYTMWHQIHLNDCKIISIATVYIPPFLTLESKGHRLALQIMDQLNKEIEFFKDLKHEVIIVGDFNARMTSCGDKIYNIFGNIFETFCNATGLKIINRIQCYKQRTYHNMKWNNSNYGSIVDLVLVSDSEFWSNERINMKVYQQYTDSDHYAIGIKIKLQNNKLNNENTIYKRTFKIKLKEEIELIEVICEDFMKKWYTSDGQCTFKYFCEKILEDNSKTEEIKSKIIYDTFMFSLNESIIKFNGYNVKLTPKSYNDSNNNSNDSKLNEIINEINNLINDKTLNEAKLEELIEKYDKRKTEIKNETLNKKLKDIRNNYSKLNNKLKFYDLIKNISNKRYEFPLHNKEEQVLLDDSSKVELIFNEVSRLSSFNAFTDNKTKQIKELMENNFLNSFNNYDSLLDCDITAEEIRDTINGISNNKSSFIDGLSWKLVKTLVKYEETANIYAIFLNSIFIKLSKIHKKILITRSIAIDKGFIAHDASDLRILRLKSINFAIIDRLVQRRINPIIESNLTEFQNAYRNKRSCEDNILLLRMAITDSKIRNNELFIVTLDMSKAIDRVNIVELLNKLFKININSKLFRLLCFIYNNSYTFTIK